MAVYHLRVYAFGDHSPIEQPSWPACHRYRSRKGVGDLADYHNLFFIGYRYPNRQQTLLDTHNVTNRIRGRGVEWDVPSTKDYGGKLSDGYGVVRCVSCGYNR